MQHKTSVFGKPNRGPQNLLFGILVLLFLSACTQTGSDTFPKSFQQASWAANGYWGPLRDSDPVIIDLFDSKSACKAGLEDWLNRQAGGQEVSGECLPIDRR